MKSFLIVSLLFLFPLITNAQVSIDAGTGVLKDLEFQNLSGIYTSVSKYPEQPINLFMEGLVIFSR